MDESRQEVLNYEKKSEENKSHCHRLDKKIEFNKKYILQLEA